MNMCREYTAVKIDPCTTRLVPLVGVRDQAEAAESTCTSPPGSPSTNRTVARRRPKPNSLVA
jgi:hypothetical protein